MKSTPSAEGFIDLEFADLERDLLEYNREHQDSDNFDMQASSPSLQEHVDAEKDSLFGSSPPGSPMIPPTEEDTEPTHLLREFQSAEQVQFQSLEASTHLSVVTPTPRSRIAHPATTLANSDRPRMLGPRTGPTDDGMGSIYCNEASPQQSYRRTSQVQQTLRQQPDRPPFQDVRNASACLLSPRPDSAQAAIIRDDTIPNGLLEKQQKRQAVSRLQTAFESAQPVKSEEEYHILDGMCLELIEGITLSHLFGASHHAVHDGQIQVQSNYIRKL